MQSFLFYEHLAGIDVLNKEFGARMVTLYQLFHHDSEALRPNENEQPVGDVDSVIRRVQESVKDHHNKWAKIHELNTKPEHFKGKLGVNHWKRGQEKDADKPIGAGWKNALSAISYEDFDLTWGYIHRAPVVDIDVAMKFLMKLVRSKGAILETREIKEDLHVLEWELGDDFKGRHHRQRQRA